MDPSCSAWELKQHTSQLGIVRQLNFNPTSIKIVFRHQQAQPHFACSLTFGMATMATGSSRIFIRNLPPSLSDSEFRSHFSRGREDSITDTRFFANRRIGYVGYKSPEEAAAAVKYFNKSFIRMSRIAVELASPYADRQTDNRKREEQPPFEDVERKETPLKRKREEEVKTQDPKLNEFLGIMNPSNKKTWQNEVMDGVESSVPAHDVEEAVSDEDIQVIPATKHGKHQGTEVLEEDFGNGEPELIPLNANLDQPDDTWLRSRTTKSFDNGVLSVASSEDISDEPFEDENEANNEQNQPSDISKPESISYQPSSIPNLPEKPPHIQDDDLLSNELTTGDRIRSHGRLYIRNLPFKTTEDELREHFSSFGSLQEVRLCSMLFCPYTQMMNQNRDI
jgi:multiple RNA-binding domain-containing protein 1